MTHSYASFMKISALYTSVCLHWNKTLFWNKEFSFDKWKLSWDSQQIIDDQQPFNLTATFADQTKSDQIDYTPQIQMDNLPFELFERIFGFLPLAEKIRAKRVSKFWKRRIDHLEIKSLLVTSDSEFDKDLRASLASAKLFDSNEFIDFLNSVPVNLLSSMNPRAKVFSFLSSTRSILQSRLKQIVLFNVYHLEVAPTLSLFNQIQKLNVIDTRRIESKITICLPQLTTLSLSFKGEPKILLVTPKLKKLELIVADKNRTEFDVLFPSTIQYARFSYYHRSIEQMTGLKTLHCDDIAQIDEIAHDLLLRLTELDEVHANTVDLFKRMLAQKTVYSKPQLKLFFCGLQTNSLVEFRDCTRNLNSQRLRLYLKNPGRLAQQLPFATKLKYSDVEAVAQVASARFWRRFVNLDCIKIPPRVNEAALIDFISLNRSINTLEFRIDSIAIGFLRRLATSYPFMRLVLKKPLKRSKKKSRSDHEEALRSICFLTRLAELEIDVDVSLDMLGHLWTNLPNLARLTFRWRESTCNVQRLKSERIAFEQDQIERTYPSFAILIERLRLPDSSDHYLGIRLFRPAFAEPLVGDGFGGNFPDLREVEVLELGDPDDRFDLGDFFRFLNWSAITCPHQQPASRLDESRLVRLLVNRPAELVDQLVYLQSSNNSLCMPHLQSP